MSDIAILGAGAWGIALAIQAVRAGNHVVLWARSGADSIAETRGSPRLPGFVLPEQVRVTGDIGLLSGMAIAAVPTQALRSVSAALTNVRELVICAKGIETGTLRLPLEIAAETQPKTIAAVLTGPNFAHEIASGQPAAAVVASLDQPLREAVMARLATPAFRLYGSDDPIGAQLGGAAKNVIAIAAGAVTGAGLGENARAALITRGLAELARLTVALGGRAETVMGLSGLGDLLLTCTGPASRNFSLGLALGRGARLAEILAARQAVTEGVTTAPALVARAQDVDMPICEAVAAFLAGRTTLHDAIAALLARPRRDE
ncbi:MAG: NAD(P)H-dependent glycerol-3-phosphate dehydrogenase [Acetobacteraceae bacterium]|jgi:glycerol-3-phosphate dehydrogenase (NAD(P)+)